MSLGVDTAALWYSETEIFEPCAATHGYRDVPPVTSAVGVDHVPPKFEDWLSMTRVDDGNTSSHTATSRPLPPSATTGNAWPVSAALAGETGTLVNVRP